MDKKLLSDLKEKIYRIFKSLNAYLIQSCNNFKDFTGRDIDAFYKKNTELKKISKNIIIRDKNKNDFRFHINSPQSTNFLSLDVQELPTIPSAFRTIFTKNFNKKIFCKKTRLNHLDEKSIIFFKLYKYFYVTIFSYDQLKDLKKRINKLKKKDLYLILNSIKEVLPGESSIIVKFFTWKFDTFIKNKKIQNFFSEKKINRQKKRTIFEGKLNFKNIIFSKKFIYALIFGDFAKWKKTHNPMPAIAIVGNDGSGKTSVVEHIRKNFSKMDPLIFDMKVSNPLFFLFDTTRKKLKKIKKYKFVKKVYLINFIISALGEILGLFDRYAKYRIGMAWADSGNGLTIFERYPTDRVRGEFPDKKNKWFPLEQFFPLPDGFVYLDVLPKESISRKKNDNHSLEEMKSKRENYLRLIKEFDEVEILLSSKKINNKIMLTKNYIFELYLKKKKKIKIDGKNARVKWKKNYNRVLVGNNLNKSQKASFFE